MGSLLRPVDGCYDRCVRSAGRRLGSVVLHRTTSARFAIRVLVRRGPHSVLLHWVAAVGRGLVQLTKGRMPRSLKCSRCPLSTWSEWPACVLGTREKQPVAVGNGPAPVHQRSRPCSQGARVASAVVNPRLWNARHHLRLQVHLTGRLPPCGFKFAIFSL